MILCTQEFKDVMNRGCPLVLGGPLPHVIAAKALAFQEAIHPSFQTYASKVIANAHALAESLIAGGATLFTGGTDNHLVVINVLESFGLNGRQAEKALLKAFMTVNRNMIPNDSNGPWYTSGIRIGSAAVSTLGMGVEEMSLLGLLITKLLKNCQPSQEKRAEVMVDPRILDEVRIRIKDLLSQFPLYPELIL